MGFTRVLLAPIVAAQSRRRTASSSTTTAATPRTLWAEPLHCVCVFIGSSDAYQNYRAILARPLPQADNVAPDYKTQASALLSIFHFL